METIKGFKGFDKDLSCNPNGKVFNYSIGQEYEENDAKACSKGFHFCEYPLDVFSFYPPCKSRYCKVEGSNKIDKSEGNKVATSKIKIGCEIGIKGIVEGALKFTFDKIKWSNKPSATGNYSGASATGNYSGASATGNYSGASATGNYSGASATGNYSGASATGYKSGASATGNCSGASATGYKSGASAGKGCIALSTGMLAKARGKIGSWIVVSECEKRNNEYFIIDVKCSMVDGITLLEDVYYILKDGKFVVSDEQ